MKAFEGCTVDPNSSCKVRLARQSKLRMKSTFKVLIRNESLSPSEAMIGEQIHGLELEKMQGIVLNLCFLREIFFSLINSQ